MWRLQYRGFGGRETLVTDHTINASSDRAGIRCYGSAPDLRRPVVKIFQQGTHTPDTTVHRWMAGMAMDKDGSIALGYGAGSATDVPEIRYAGTRLWRFRPGTPPRGRGALCSPAAALRRASIVGATTARWTSIRWTAALSDDAAEYYSAHLVEPDGGPRIASFQLPSCGLVPPPSPPPPQVADAGRRVAARERARCR